MTEKKSWIVPVDEDGVVTFPDELMEQLGWKEGDDIYFDVTADGHIILTKEVIDSPSSITNAEPQVDP